MVSLLLPVIYLAFISLGLPDSLLGSAWPVMYEEFNVPISYAGIVSMIIAAGTIVSSLNSDRLTKKFGPGLVTALSVSLTCISLFAFSFCRAFWLLCILAVPYGLGAGSVDAALNNYVALNYKSRHMSWLHCMWGVGASTGPYIMGYALSSNKGWNSGYMYIGFIQIVLTAIIFCSLSLWKKKSSERLSGIDVNDAEENIAAEVSATKALSLKEILAIPGAKQIMFCFFCYCAIEQTTGLWAASYLTVFKGVSAETAAKFASFFYLGITVGRAINGFITMKLSDKTLIRVGQGIIFSGIILMVIPGLPDIFSLAGFIVVGLGCAPIYPCIIHSTPENFGAEKSQAIVGVQMASAYVGTCLMPPVFGLIAKHINIALLPVFLVVLLIIMVTMHEIMLKIKGKKVF